MKGPPRIKQGLSPYGHKIGFSCHKNFLGLFGGTYQADGHNFRARSTPYFVC